MKINEIYKILDEIGLPRGKYQLLITSAHVEQLAQAILAVVEKETKKIVEAMKGKL